MFNISRGHSINPTVCEKHDFENNPFPYREPMEMLKYRRVMWSYFFVRVSILAAMF